MSTRLRKLRDKLPEKGLDALLVSQAENRRYLSGFTGSAGYLLVSQNRAVLATDFRYVEQSRLQAPDFEIMKIEGEVGRWFPQLVAPLSGARLGFESRDLSFAGQKQFAEAAATLKQPVNLTPTEGLVESLRTVKEPEEIACLSQAAALADAAITEVVPRIQPGMSERMVAWMLEAFMREQGSQPLPFDIIVAAGPNGALPHYQPADTAILANQPVVIDLGARISGYASDMTRTICLGEGDRQFQRIYDIVLGAQLTAMATIAPGMTGEQADALARNVIVEAGYGDNFGHSLGHGTGLATHEDPRVGPNSRDILQNDMVFTVEPGIYIPGWGGVRIEDMVVLKEGKIKSLSKARK
ncbi:MAG: aminopeptidase P family protein [Chloroflexi bacterium]|nr:aminopeptidase P family protein [Chloroflexota bacterium]